VTDLNDAGNSLEAEHEALLSFMYLSPVGIIRSDALGNVDMLNPLAVQLLMPLVGSRGVDNIFESLSSVAPELRNMVSSYHAIRGPVCEGHRIFLTPAGEKGIVMSCTIIKVNPDMLMTVLTDISKQVEAERRARQNEAWLSGIYTSVNDFAFFTLDASGSIDSWNPSVEHVTGYSSSDVIGRPLSLFYARDEVDPYRFPEHIALTREEGWHIHESSCQAKSGSRFYAQMLVAVLREDDGGFVGYSVVLRDVSEQKISTDELTRLLTTDHLTGAANRAHFFKVAEKETARSIRHGQPLSFLMMDADYFKRINDTFGHLAGDEVLKRIVVEAKRQLRRGDLVARLGGEEFGFMLPATGYEDAMEIAERVRAAIEGASIPTATTGANVTVTVSLGCASLTPAVSTMNELLGIADRALYAAKTGGRNRVIGS